MSTYLAELYQAVEGAEVSGANVSALVGTLRDEELRPVIEKAGFAQIDVNKWYPQQQFLDLIRIIEDTLTYEELVAIGMKGAEVVNLPPSIQSFDDIPDAIVAAYGLNHRHVPNGEGYALERADNSVAVICNIPYPPFVLFGYVHGLIRRFAKQDARQYTVVVKDDVQPYQIVITW